MDLLLSGVKRAHLVDAKLDGGLLLELYSRDGVGTMISADFYEGEGLDPPVNFWEHPKGPDLHMKVLASLFA